MKSNRYRWKLCSFLIGWAAAFIAVNATASSTEPFPGANGIPGGTYCNTGGCHVGSASDSDLGGVRIDGLPQQWLPDTTYHLMVVVERPSAARFGFQLAAIYAGSAKQAGTLIAGESAVSVITYIGVQYAQHNNAPYANGRRTFLVDWHSPATTSSGDVDFYVAGNTANGDMARTGDIPYFESFRVSPGGATPTSRSFTFPGPGSLSLRSNGASATAQGGYAQINVDSGSMPPSGIAVFGYRANNVLVSEAGVPAAPLMTSGRTFAEVNADGTVNTGIAIANPGTQTATIRFYTTDSAGVSSAIRFMTLPAGGQIAKFLTEAPFNTGFNVLGSFSFSSDHPITVIALRGLTNQRSEFLITTLPVTDTANAPTGPQIVPHFAEGGGWTTQIVLINPSDSVLTGEVKFISASGNPVRTSPYVIPAGSAIGLRTSGTGTTAVTGSVRVEPASGAAPVSYAVFSYTPTSSSITVTEAGVPSIRGSSFRMSAEFSANVQTGIALANGGPVPVVATLELYRGDGLLGASTIVTIPASGQISKFLSEFFSNLTSPFQGTLRIRTAGEEIAVVGLRGHQNERADFLITTMPAALESNTPSINLFFPHIVDGGGYTTEFVLFGMGSTGQNASGTLRFYKQDGSGLSLAIIP